MYWICYKLTLYTGSFKKIWRIKTRSHEEYHINTDQIWRTILCWMEPHATITVMLGTSLTRRFLRRWIGRAVNNDQHLLTVLWPPRSPDLRPCDFFLWGYVKDNAYKPPLPQNVRELQDRLRAAVQTVDGNMLKRVWQAGVRLSYWHLQSNEGRSHWAFVSWFLLGNKLGHLHYLCVKLYLILTVNK